MEKKSYKIYYLLLVEGATEFNLFAYLTKVRFRVNFEESDIQFRPKINIAKNNISQGNLNGVSCLKDFKKKYMAIKKDYKGQTLFFVLDKDLDDSVAIGELIECDDNIVQFVEYNSEYLLLKLGNKNPKNPSDFANMREFREYCKAEFEKQFGKKASDFKKDSDFESIFNNISDEEIRAIFDKLFATLS